MADVTDYTDLVTSEHKTQPKFIAMVSAVLQPLVDLQNLAATVPSAYDVDTAVGTQLDVVGQWVGRTRFLTVPINNPYFSLDTSGLGLDQAVWWTRFDPTTKLLRLPDDEYRILIKAVIGANQWDGTVEGAYDVFNVIFQNTGFTLFINEVGTMEITIAIGGAVLDVVVKALMTSGALITKPAGVNINSFATASLPLFAFDAETDVFAGFDEGNWEQPA